jgi:hypothetical protein
LSEAQLGLNPGVHGGDTVLADTPPDQAALQTVAAPMVMGDGGDGD